MEGLSHEWLKSQIKTLARIICIKFQI